LIDRLNSENLLYTANVFEGFVCPCVDSFQLIEYVQARLVNQRHWQPSLISGRCGRFGFW